MFFILVILINDYQVCFQGFLGCLGSRWGLFGSASIGAVLHICPIFSPAFSPRHLAATGDAQALPLLKKAHAQLQARAERIQDAQLRASFLNQVAAHRAIVADYARALVMA